ncbi:hypothetical protein PLESTF_001253700 [Pleodorina starrii]|nr:hypothetical protein PLESTF_001253700 [Pleodorina starrii]
MLQTQCYIDLARLLVTGTRSFYNNPTFSDITLVCPDGRQLRCHQVILAASSKRLASVLKQGGFTGSKLPVQGVDSDALDTLIDSFYTGECPLTLATAASIYDAAVKLEVNGLPGAVEQFLSASLTPSNACLLLDRAMNTKTGRLAEVCLQFIRARLADVVPSLEFSASSMDVVVQICTDVANNRHSPQLALQVALAWLRGPPSGPSRTHLLPALADQIGISPELLQTYMRSSGGNSPGADGSGGSGGNGGGGGGGGSLGAVSLLGEPPSLDSALPLSSLPLLQLLPPGQLQQLGMGGGAAGAAAAQLLLGQGKGGNTAALRSLLEDDGSGGAGGNGGGGGRGGAGGGGGGGIGGVDGAAEAALAQRLGNLRRELEEGAAGGFAGALAAAAAAASNRGKRPRTDDSRRSSGWEQEPMSGLVRGLSGEQDMVSPAGAGGGGFPGAGGSLGKLAALPSAPSYADPPPRDRRTPQVKGVCHVEGCYTDLTGLRDYHLRYKICEFHLKVSSVLKDGVPQRFCQQCGRFHHLSEFDGNRRSCRTMLARHNMRRAKKMGQSGSPMAEDQGNAAAAAAAGGASAGANGDLSAKLLQQLGGTAGLVAAMASLQQQQQQPQAAGAQQQQQHQQQHQLQQLAQLSIPDGMSLTDAVAAAMAGLQGNGASAGGGGGGGGGLLGSPTGRRLNELLDGLGRGANGSATGAQMGSLLEALGANGSGGGGSGGGAGGGGSGGGAAAPAGDAAASDGGAAMPGGGDGGGERDGHGKMGGVQGDAVAALEAIAAAAAAATAATSASGDGASSPTGDGMARHGRLPSGGGAADENGGGGVGPDADGDEDKAAKGQ